MTATSAEPTTLTAELNRLWRLAGRPSSRKVAALVDGLISHATVNDLIRGKYSCPQWETVSRVATALGATAADIDTLGRLWADVVDQRDDRPERPRRDSQIDAINNLAAAINNLAEAYREGRTSA